MTWCEGGREREGEEGEWKIWIRRMRTKRKLYKRKNCLLFPLSSHFYNTVFQSYFPFSHRPFCIPPCSSFLIPCISPLCFSVAHLLRYPFNWSTSIQVQRGIVTLSPSLPFLPVSPSLSLDASSALIRHSFGSLLGFTWMRDLSQFKETNVPVFQHYPLELERTRTLLPKLLSPYTSARRVALAFAVCSVWHERFHPYREVGQARTV